jgi:hypothetical protein
MARHLNSIPVIVGIMRSQKITSKTSPAGRRASPAACAGWTEGPAAGRGSRTAGSTSRSVVPSTTLLFAERSPPRGRRVLDLEREADPPLSDPIAYRSAVVSSWAQYAAQSGIAVTGPMWPPHS